MLKTPSFTSWPTPNQLLFNHHLLFLCLLSTAHHQQDAHKALQTRLTRVQSTFGAFLGAADVGKYLINLITGAPTLQCNCTGQAASVRLVLAGNVLVEESDKVTQVILWISWYLDNALVRYRLTVTVIMLTEMGEESYWVLLASSHIDCLSQTRRCLRLWMCLLINDLYHNSFMRKWCLGLIIWCVSPTFPHEKEKSLLFVSSLISLPFTFSHFPKSKGGDKECIISSKTLYECMFFSLLSCRPASSGQVLHRPKGWSDTHPNGHKLSQPTATALSTSNMKQGHNTVQKRTILNWNFWN